MATFPVSLDHLPQLLSDSVRRRLSDVQAGLDSANLAWPDVPALSELPGVWAASDFVANSCVSDPGFMTELLSSGDLCRDYESGEYRKRLQSLITPDIDDLAMAILLRKFRRREMVRIAWRDIAGTADLHTTLMDLSLLAEVCVQVTSAWLQSKMVPEFGVPRSQSGEELDLIVMGMGKLGAWELNFSSDIDLIFVFMEEGQTEGGKRSLSHGEFFVRLGQQLSNLLNNNTADGYVFRVDTRLRPFGNSGQLAITFDAMEAYYERHGREWERYALIKARVISGNEKHAAELMTRLRPFIYRRYLDYSAFESLREMKQLIASEVKRKGMELNVKLGSGGIREIEFIGQAFQLIRGGQEKRLQDRRIQRILDVLGKLDLVPVFVVERLIEAYRFLRLTENRLQEMDDQQTHVLPGSAYPQLRVAFSMGFDSWGAFLKVLDGHRSLVKEHFEQIFSAPQAEEGQKEDDHTASLMSMWLGRLEDSEAISHLKTLGFEKPDEAYSLLVRLRDSSSLRSLSPRARTRLDRLIPLMVSAVAEVEQADDCLIRVMRLLEAISRRSVYVALLIEHPMALSQLVRLCAVSPWVADQLTRSPVLLDELLDPRRLYEPVTRDDLATELENRLAAVEADDEEREMDVLRQFKQANVLRVAASQLTQAMSLAKVSDHLTFIAEVVLDRVLYKAQSHLQKRHGIPRFTVDGETHQAGFCVIAYGKLGGYELGFGSDLDVVFLHDSTGTDQLTDGDKSVDNSVYFARLGQRIIHLLNTQTAHGLLYEVDTRLRPSGQSGLLVSSIDSFSDYQWKQAWTWEHQALVRARPVSGSPELIERFALLRREVLCQARDLEKLREDVSSMRVRMRKELAHSESGQFDLKQDIGGIVDIEFIIQYLVLRWAHEYPALTDFPDNLRILEGLARAGLMSEADAELLKEAYLTYRHQAHELTLRQQPTPLAGEEAFHELREGVTRIWNEVLEPSS